MYELIDIYLEKSLKYTRILDINPEVLLLYAGYNEFTNKRLEEAVLQVLANQKVTGKSMWVYFKGTQKDFITKYPEWHKQMMDQKYQELFLDRNSKVVEVEDI